MSKREFVRIEDLERMSPRQREELFDERLVRDPSQLPAEHFARVRQGIFDHIAETDSSARSPGDGT